MPPGPSRGAARARGRRGSSTSRCRPIRSEEHTSELQSQSNLVCRLLLEKKKKRTASDDVPPTGLAQGLAMLRTPADVYENVPEDVGHTLRTLRLAVHAEASDAHTSVPAP